MDEKLLMKFVHFLISEECEGCSECDPLSEDKCPVACYVEGRAKWYVNEVKEFVKRTSDNI